MAGPWEKYAPAKADASGPWEKYVQPEQQREVVQEVGDGRVYRMQDGSLAYSSPGFSTTDQGRIKELMDGATPRSLLQRDVDRHVIENFPAASRAAKFVEGVPFVGTYSDEIAGALGGNTSAIRAAQGAMEREKPGQSLALGVLGGLTAAAPAVPAIGAGFNALRAGYGTMGAVAGTGLMGAAAGATEGAVSGYGRGGTPFERRRLAKRDAMVGAAAGGTMALLGPLIGAGAKSGVAKVREWTRKLDISAIAQELSISKQAARIVKKALINDDLDQAAKAIASGGDDAMLADSGPATRALLDASSQTGGEALSITRGRVGARATEQGQKFAQTLDDVLGSPGGVRAAARDISQRTSAARQAAYSRAYASPIDYASDQGRKIEQVLERVPPNTLRTAISEANEAMQEAGERNLQILADIADDGSVTFREMPNVRQLDELKKALGNVGRNEVDQFGRPTAAGLRANRLAGDLRDALGEAAPAYKRALQLGGDKIREDQALDIGRRLLSRATKPEDVREFMTGGISAEARQAAKRGLRENLDDIMSNARTTLQSIEEGSFDFAQGQDAAKQALDAVRNMTTEANIKKIKMILGPSDAGRLIGELKKTSDALALRAAVASNSKTAIRQSIQSEARDVSQPGAVRRFIGKGGNPLDALGDATQTLMEIDPASATTREKAYMAEVADALTRIRGADAQRALSVIQGAIAGQPIRDEQAALIGRVLAEQSASAGYHTTTQALE